MKIMIVDDHAGMRVLLRNILTLGQKNFLLEGDHLDLVEFESGEEAIEQCTKSMPDVILMDFELPNMNGLEATKQILKKDSEAKIVFVTSIESASLRQQVEGLSVLALISKKDLSDILPILSSQNHKTDTL